MREPPYERSAPRLPWGVKGGARAVGRHTLTNRHSFIAGVRRSSARNLHAQASLGGRCAISAREEHHETTGVLMTATQKRLLLALTAVTALATATPTTSPSTPVRGSFGESRVRGG